MALVYPLIAWGDPEDISASPWIDTNPSPTVTSGHLDPFGGTSAYQIDDNNAGAAESRGVVTGVTNDGEHVVVLCLNDDTAPVSTVGLYDETAATWRHRIDYTWSGAPTGGTASGSGTILTPILLGGGWYACIFTATGVVAANANSLRLFGATATASSTGKTTYYVRNMALLPPLDNVVADDDPRAGYEQVQAPSGEEDAWTVATDYQLTADIRHVSKLPVDSPLTYSGWDGLNEFTGIDAGIGAMLRAGRDKTDLIYVPDRSDCSANVTSKLKDPLQGGVGQEEDGTRRVRITLRNGTTEYAGYV